MVKNKLIVQGNELTIAHFESTQHERNIVYAIMAQIKNDDLPTATYDIKVSDIATHTGRRVRNDDFKDAIKRLLSRIFTIKDSGGVLQTTFISSAYFDDRGFVSIAIDARLRPYLFELKKNFTVFGLNTAIALNSIYSKRLYEMLCQFRHTGRLRISVRDFKERFCLINEDGTEKFQQWVSFENKVLKVASAEINEKADFQFDYSLKKEGRKVVGIDFVVRETMPQPMAETLVVQKDADPKLERMKDRMKGYGLSEKQIMDVLKKQTPERINKVLYDLDCNRDKINSHAAFLVKVFEI